MEGSAGNVAATAVVNKESQQELMVSKFASCLGASSDSPFAGSSSSDFAQCLSPSVAAEAVVCSLPSLDMPPPPKEEGKSSPLPELGQHREKPCVPEMTASVLNNAVVTPSYGEDEEAARHLGTLTSWTKSSLIYAPPAVNKNISSTLSSLIDSRVRAWTLLLLRHSLSTGDGASRSRLLSMLSCSVKLKSTATKFQTLPLPDSARGQPKEADAILPLLFEAQLQLSIHDKVETVSLRAPGTIAGECITECCDSIEPRILDLPFFASFSTGNFAKDETLGLTKVDVRLDTGVLLESMIEQARLAVFKAVARATSVTPDIMTVPTGAFSQAPSSLAGFGASLKISSNESTSSSSSGDSIGHPSTQMLKARSSALRLSNVLHGKADDTDSQMSSSPLGKTRKNRSVRWDHPMQSPSRDASNFPSAKRQRMVQSQARLRSTKSFGRPHAEHGSGPRNATFGDFGSSHHSTWGKDGKLKNHPRPGGGLTPRLSAFHTNNSPTEAQNARFDLQSKVKVSRGNTLSVLGMVGAAQQQQQAGSTSLPRTATALENWLVNATKGGAAAGLL